MKKVVVLLIMLSCICSFQVSHAQIDKRIDSFDESIIMISYNKIGNIDSLQLDKEIKNNEEVIYTLLLSSESNKDEKMYTKDDAMIKIDGVIYNVKVISNNYRHFEYTGDLVNVKVDINQEIINKLKSSNKVSMRFYHRNGLANTLDIPDEILNEWKQVIEMEK